MNLAPLFRGISEKPIRIGLVGAGEFGLMMLAQARRFPLVSLQAVCDIDVERACAALTELGFSAADMLVCDSVPQAIRAIEAGKIAVVADASLVVMLPLDVIVEATGNPEAAASTVLSAIENGRHTVLATKEAEVLVGPVLARRARAAGLVHTPADGDQPSLLVGLIDWARLLGFHVIGAGKSTSARNDALWDPEARTVTLGDRVHRAPDYAAAFALAADDVNARLAARVLPGMRNRPIVDDLCEVCIVANHTDLDPDAPGLHVPLARTIELPQIFRPRADGGILGRAGTVDMFRGLRRADEQAFAGGVFVTVETPNPAFGRKFAKIGIPVSADGRVMLIHNPMHLLGAEAVISALCAERFHAPTGGSTVRQRFDLVGRAERDFAPGDVIRLVGDGNPGASSNVRHSIDGFEPLLMPSRAMGDGLPLPYYLAAGRRVKSRIPAGSLVLCNQMEIDARSVLSRLRSEQDAQSDERDYAKASPVSVN